MITCVSIVSVFVKDQDESKAFYTDILGFEAKDDITMGDYRWLTVVHPEQPELQINLCVPGPPYDEESQGWMRKMLDKGMSSGIGLNVDDCHQTFKELSAKGVTFLQEPADRPYGVEAVMRDNSGNWIVLVEPREFTPGDFEAFEG